MENLQMVYSPAVWQQDFNEFIDRFAKLFTRSEPREQSKKYIKALLAPVERKNGWQMAEYIGDKIPDAMQRLLFQSHWDEAAAIDELQAITIEKFGDEEAIGILDETGFIKKGKRSAGVQRQYSGTAGKTENCQVGTFLSYATKNDHIFLDRRLYLPETWCSDKERRRLAKIPDDVKFQTKPEHAIEMLEHAWKQGVPMRWVAGDAVYGNSCELRNTVNLAGKYYVFGVRSPITVWKKWPEPFNRKKHWRGRGRAIGKPRYPRPESVVKFIAACHPSRWKRYSVGDGEKGPRVYDWARMRVVESENGLPVRQAWLLARRSITDLSDIAYYLSNAPLEVSLLTLATVAATRYTVEQCFEEAKGETGLDHYEVRNWHSWYRHITLSMMAHTFLAWLRSKSMKKKMDFTS